MNTSRTERSLSFAGLRPLTHGLPPVIMLGASDYPGAGGAMAALHDGLTAAGANVTTLVMLPSPYDNDVTPVAQGSRQYKAYEVMRRALLRGYPGHSPHYELFSVNKSFVEPSILNQARQAGIVHPHWVSGMISFPRSLSLLRGKPLVWTLHDMNPLTGGCHYTAGCEKYALGGCGQCPQLGESTGGMDLAAGCFSTRQAGYADLQLHVATPSRWLGECARKSRLLGAFPQVTIPNAVDTDIFRPVPRDQARAALDLPADKQIILFSATSAKRRNKGRHVLLRALNLVCSRQPGSKPLLLLVGEGEEKSLPDHDCRSLGFVADRAILAAAYSAADVFVLPSFQDNLPNTLLEAQACGTPGIGFYGAGGAEDIIQDGVTGYLATHPGLPLEGGALPSRDGAYLSVKPESITDLADKIERILALPAEEYAAMRRACREHALFEYAPEVQAARYLRLYRRVLGLPDVTVPGLDGLMKMTERLRGKVRQTS